MYRFEPQAPLDVTTYPEPAAADRSGPPLTQGVIFMMIDTMASEHCDPEVLATLEKITPEEWYHGQLLETMLNRFEQKSPQLPSDIAKSIYYTLQEQFMAMGMRTPQDVITTMPAIWQFVTRGDSGEMRSQITGPRSGRIELEQPYNCKFESGAIEGALECFDAYNVRINHPQCMRDGAPYCILEVSWDE